MRSTRAHKAATGLVAGSLFGAATACWWYAVGDPVALATVGAGALVGFLTDPDDDLGELSKLGAPHQWPVSLPRAVYGRLFKHRSFWSHFPVVSTATRLAVFGSVWLAALSPCLLLLPPAGVDFTAVWPVLKRAFCGLAVADAVHAVMDVMPVLRRL
jgi:uncharacterized metal-binding protein